MPQLLRNHPGLLVWVLLFGIGTLVCLVHATLAHRSGGSLRPILWFASFFLVVGLPQFGAHLLIAVSSSQREAPRLAAMDQLKGEAPREARLEAARLLFGPDADPDLIADARPLFGEALAGAEQALLASFATGETALLARFRGHSAAQKAWVAYLQHTGLSRLGGTGDSERGYAATRPVGDRAYVVHRDNLLAVWTAPDDAALRRRMQAAGFPPHRRAPLAASPASETAGEAGGAGGKAPTLTDVGPFAWFATPTGMGLLAGGLALYLFLVVSVFFKGLAWAGGASPDAGVHPVPAEELRQRLEAINRLDVPFRIEPGDRPDELFCTWRYADAKWVDLARAHGMRRVHRIRMRLDAGSRVVRATDYVSSHDWSAGAGGVRVEWKTGFGTVLQQVEHRRVFGIQVGPDGSLRPELSYAYTFNLQEMKAPLMNAVTRAGWSWRPVTWPGSPSWLRWLTE